MRLFHEATLYKTPLVVACALLVSALFTSSGQAHSGRTNAAGCHAGSQPFHCHGQSNSNTVDRQDATLTYTRHSHPWSPDNAACHPAYQGVCLPRVAIDIDCAGGSGNGPAYVVGPIWVVGKDTYGLDGDSNGVGCQ